MREIPINAFYYVRHGETTDNSGDIIGGTRDVELTEAGIRKAEALAAIVSKLVDIECICCSPMKRAIHTTELLNKDAKKPVKIIKNLHEWDVGDCTGLPRKDYPELSNWNFDPPGGETRQHLKARVGSALSDAMNPMQGKSVCGSRLIVAHAGIWWALADILGLKQEMIANCALFKIIYSNGAWHTSQLV